MLKTTPGKLRQTRQNPISKGQKIASLSHLRNQRQQQLKSARQSLWRLKSISTPIRQSKRNPMILPEKLLPSGAKRIRIGNTQANGKIGATKKTRLLNSLTLRCARRSAQKLRQMHKLISSQSWWKLTIISLRVASVPPWIRSNLSSTKSQKAWRKRFPKSASKTLHRIPQKKRTRKKRKRIKHLLQSLKLQPKLQRKLISLMIWVPTCRTTLQKKTPRQRRLKHNPLPLSNPLRWTQWPLPSATSSFRASSPRKKRRR